MEPTTAPDPSIDEDRLAYREAEPPPEPAVRRRWGTPVGPIVNERRRRQRALARSIPTTRKRVAKAEKRDRARARFFARFTEALDTNAAVPIVNRAAVDELLARLPRSRWAVSDPAPDGRVMVQDLHDSTRWFEFVPTEARP